MREMQRRLDENQRLFGRMPNYQGGFNGGNGPQGGYDGVNRPNRGFYNGGGVTSGVRGEVQMTDPGETRRYLMNGISVE